MFDDVKKQSEALALELIEAAKLKKGDIVVIGCSSSEIVGEKIGKGSSLEAAKAVFEGVYPVFKPRGIFLAAQCCEHLNRCIITEREVAEKKGLEIVNVVPKPKAGGSFATTAYENFDFPVALEHIRADAGIDIGDTLIGMHLKDVAVPLRLSVKEVGKAHVAAARTRAKFIGGERAHYDEAMM
ncbi:MAG: TIGR01440 family protein [Acutalibacteraceae bacterium]